MRIVEQLAIIGIGAGALLCVWFILTLAGFSQSDATGLAALIVAISGLIWQVFRYGPSFTR